MTAVDLSTPAPPPSSPGEVTAWIVAEMARQQAVADLKAALPPSRRRCSGGASVVFSLRLDRDELEALEFVAGQRRIKPSVLARNLIRTGLTIRAEEGLSEVVEQLDRLVDQLRGFVP